MRSLRTRLLLAVSATTAVVLILLGIGIYVALRRELARNFDRDSQVKAQAIASLTSVHGTTVKLDADDLQMPEFAEENRPKQAEYYEVWSEGKVVARSPGLKGDDLPYPKMEGVNGQESYGDLKLPGGVEGRMVAMAFSPALENDEDEVKGRSVRAELVVGRPTHEMEEVLDDAAMLIWGLGGAAVVVACGATWLVMRRVFLPVGIVARRIGEMRVDALGAQLAMENVPSELDPVIGKLNDLLKRLAAAFERERGFSADVAHELRTPLAGLITTLEVSRTRARESVAYEAAIDKSLAVAVRMNQLVGNLLLLARAESNQLSVVKKPARVDLVLEDCFTEYQARAAGKAVELQWHVEAPLELSTDEGQLRVILENLFDNAVTYVNAGGVLKVAGRRDGNRVVVEVANSGSVVGAEAATHVTERFWRADAARTETGVHCGLGLAIVKKIAELLGMDMEIGAEKGGDFQVRLLAFVNAAPGDKR